jgi:type VI secretion system secreted protein Hcp
MAINIYLKIDSITGDVTKSGHVGSIQVSSFSWGESIPIDAGSGARGLPAVQDIAIVTEVSRASGALAEAGFTGGVFKTVTLTALHEGGVVKSAFKELFIKFKNAFIASYSFQGIQGAEAPAERFTFAFESMEIMSEDGAGHSTTANLVIRKQG